MSFTPPSGSNVPLIFNDVTTQTGDNVVLDFDPLSNPPVSIAAQLEDVSGLIEVLANPAAAIVGQLDDVTGLITILANPIVTITAQLDDITGEIQVRAYQQAYLDGLLDDVTAEIQVEWSAGVWRGVGLNKQGTFKVNETPANAITATGFNKALIVNPIIISRHQQAAPLANFVLSAWAVVAHKYQHYQPNWLLGQPLTQNLQSAYNIPPAKHLAGNAHWELSRPLKSLYSFVYTYPPKKHLSRNFKFNHGASRAKSWGFWYDLIGLKRFRQLTIPWDEGNPHNWEVSPVIHPPPIPPPIYVPSTDLLFACKKPARITGIHVDLIFKPGCPWDGYTTSIYPWGIIVLHTVIVYRLPDMLEIPVLSASLKFDSASWAWGVSLTLRTAETMALLEAIDGEPRQVRVYVDGFNITALIEEWGESRQFGEANYTASGRSPLALFAMPYAPLRFHLETEQKTAAQLIDYELLYTGWSAAYHADLLALFTTDWLVPAGAWSYQGKSPIDAILQIAKAVGARVYSDRNEKIVHIEPRYPVSPWNWAAATPDKQIALSLIRSLSTQLAPQPLYDHVYVSGQSHGVLVSATRAGYPGTVSAPMVTDNLITYVNTGRERARNILSNVGKQARVTIDLPLNDITGLLEPGQLVEVLDTTAWRGLVTSITLNATHGVVSQTVEIERHY
jgi:hypothetical protein